MTTNNTLTYTGLHAADAERLAGELTVLSTSLQVLYANLRGFHWNVKGRAFFVLHAKFEELYDTVADQIDEVGERIVQLGHEAESRPSLLARTAEISEVAGLKSADEMVQNVLEAYKTLMARERSISKQAADFGDEVTANLMGDLLESQEKLVWMLSVTLA